MPNFVLTNKAKNDLAALGRYTTKQWGRDQRNRYLAVLDQAFHEIAQHPSLGRDCSTIRAGYRRP